MTRRRLLLLTVIGALVTVALLVWWRIPRDSSSPATLGDAIHAYRQVNGSNESSRRQPGTPEPGVYRYATVGGEEMETAIGTAQHPYPAVSTIAVLPTGCGFTGRWQVLEARWSEEQICSQERSLGLASLQEFRSFYGSDNLLRVDCNRHEGQPGPTLRPGESWRAGCEGAGTRMVVEGRTGPIRPTRVAGRWIRSLPVTYRIRISGEMTGTAIRTDRLRLSDGLLLSRKARTETEVDVIGGGEYSEQYSLRLIGLRPIQ